MEEFNIFFSINEMYVPILEIVIRSFIEHNSFSDNRFCIYVLYLSMNESSIEALENLSANNIKISCKKIDISKHSIKMVGFDRFPVEALIRAVIPEEFHDINTGLYLDSDILIRNSIEELCSVDLGDNYIAAVRDYLPVFESRYVHEFLKFDPGNYFNSGVLLMNLREMRKDRFLDKFLTCYKEHPEYRLVDQDVLNDICRGRVRFLDIKWNYQRHHFDHYLDEKTKKEFYCYKNRAVIVHFTGSRKPWIYPEVEFGEEFFKYAKSTDSLYQILKMGSEKRTQYRCDYIFPIDLIRPNSRIVLYGAGQVGRAYRKEIIYTDYCDIVLWVDKNYKDIEEPNIHSPDDIVEVFYDYVLIAVVEIAVMQDIRDKLIGMGVNKNQIIWKHPVATDKNLFSLYNFVF